jgi:hypothetical protein
MHRLPSLLAILLLLAACAGSPSGQHIDAGSGPNPALPQPQEFDRRDEKSLAPEDYS